MKYNYHKHHNIFAAGLPVVWLILNFLFFSFDTQSHGFWIITLVVIVVELSYVLSPPVYRKIFDGWTFVTRKIGQFNSYLILGIVFYLLFTPISLFFKLFGKDLLNEKIDKTASTYWHPRPKHKKTMEEYKKLF